MPIKPDLFTLVLDSDQQDDDLNGDGVLDIRDCPYPYGTTAAKKWWYSKIEPVVRAQATDTNKDIWGNTLTGVYKGKPLRPGPHPGDGDWDYMVDKIKVTQGLSHENASNIAGKVLQRKLNR